MVVVTLRYSEGILPNRRLMVLPRTGDAFFVRVDPGDDVDRKFIVQAVEHHLDDVGNAGHEIVIELD